VAKVRVDRENGNQRVGASVDLAGGFDAGKHPWYGLGEFLLKTRQGLQMLAYDSDPIKRANPLPNAGILGCRGVSGLLWLCNERVKPR
jgi:hypothetical protein